MSANKEQFFKDKVQLLNVAVKERTVRSPLLSEGKDDPCYPFLAGYMTSFLSGLMDSLDLSDEQVKRFEKSIQYNIDFMNSLDND